MSRKRFVARPDGKVLVDIRQPMLVSVEEAKQLASDAHKAAMEAERYRAQADGSGYWTVEARRAHLVTMGHRGTSRVFSPVKVRRERRCAACCERIVVGATAYAEYEPKPYSNPNWRNIRLCEPCVRPELRGRALLDRLPQLSGVGLER